MNSCPSPFKTIIRGATKYCSFPCETGFLYQNDQCDASCDTRYFTVVNDGGKKRCNHNCNDPTKPIAYWHNQECEATCPAAL